MVTREEFARVQAIVRRFDASRPSVHAFQYRGLLRCGHCGRILTGEQHRNRQGHVYTYYRCARRRPGYPMCHAPAPSDAQVTADMLACLNRLHVDPWLHEWSLNAVDWWIEQEKAGLHSTVHAAEEDLRRVETELKRADQLLVKDVLNEASYGELRQELVAQEERLKQTLSEPAAELDAWRTAVAEALTMGACAAPAFENGAEDERRSLLAQLYENFAYIDRKPTPMLRFPYTLLDSERPSLDVKKTRDVNFPHPSEIPLNGRENARPVDAHLREFTLWSGKLHDVRNLLAPP